MAYPSPSSLSPTSNVDVESENDGLYQPAQQPRHRTASISNLPEPKRCRTTPSPPTIPEPSSLQAWLNSLSSSPLPVPQCSSHPRNVSDRLAGVEDYTTLQSDKSLSAGHGEANKDVQLASARASHPTPAATPHETDRDSTTLKHSQCASLPNVRPVAPQYDPSTKDRFVAGLVGECCDSRSKCL